MAFNPNDYLKDTSKSQLNKLSDSIVGSVVAGLPTSTTSVATSISQSLINIGSSFRAVDALTSLKTDNVISGAADAFFAIAGQNVDRAGSSIADLRRTNNNLTDIIQNVNPSTKISIEKSKDLYEVFSII